jgi:hypothetical protein
MRIGKTKVTFRIDMDISKEIELNDKKFEIGFYMDIIDLSKYPPPLHLGDWCEIAFDDETHIYFDRFLNLEDRMKIINYAYKLLNNHKKKKWEKFVLKTIEGEIMYEKIFYFRKDIVHLEQFVFPRSSNARYILEIDLNKKTVLEVRFRDNRNLDNFKNVVEKIEFVFNNYDNIDNIIQRIVRDIISNNESEIKRLYNKIAEDFNFEI